MRAFFAKANTRRRGKSADGARAFERGKPRKTARHGVPFALASLAGWDKLTLFQQAVLCAVYSIPRGEVRTYAQVAQMAARLTRRQSFVNASRATGSVMKMNPYAPFIPCHRVVRSDGTLGFYSGKGGMAGKKKLLQSEGFQPNRKANKTQHP